MGDDRRRFRRLAPCQDGCRLANAGCLVLSNPVSLTATVGASTEDREKNGFEKIEQARWFRFQPSASDALDMGGILS